MNIKEFTDESITPGHGAGQSTAEQAAYKGRDMKIKKFRFEGQFNEFGFTELNAPDEKTAWANFFGIDHGAGWGIADESEVDSVQELGFVYEFDGDADEWLEAVKLGEVD